MADPASLRPYQQDAVDNTVDELGRAARVQLRAACGTGKTLMAIHVIERLHPRTGLVVILCPTLLLVSQTLTRWAEHHTASGRGYPYRALIVASDASDAERQFARQGTLLPVTTAVEEITDWIGSPWSGLRIIVGTHLSAGQIGQALQSADVEADLLVIDEAHHTAGRRTKHSALIHRDSQLPARRRLYQTATPRVMLAAPRADRTNDMLSMDDEAVFGRTAYEYPFSKAIDDGWLDDYRLVVIGVARAEILTYLRELQGDPRASRTNRISPQEAAVHVAIARAAAEWDLRRIVAFAPSIAAAARLARDLPITVARSGVGPARQLTSEHMSGLDTINQREAKLKRLKRPPDDGWTVLSNVRVLGEGVDIPAIDSVVFTHPKRSTTDVVQAVGRALRPHPDGRGTATILVPILLPDDPAELDDISDDHTFAALWQVVRALRAHDDLLAADLDRRRTQPSGWYASGPPAQLITRFPEAFDSDTWMRELTVRIVRAASSSWWEGLGAATRYREEHGHLDIPLDYIDPATGHGLGRWLNDQRQIRRDGRLADERVAALDELGIVWEPRQQLWAEGLAHAVALHARHGDLEVPTSYVDPETGFRLGAWLNKQRQLRREGRLADERVAALDELGIVWEPRQQQWTEGLEQATRWHAQHGDLEIPQGYVDPATGYRLGRWLNKQRQLRREGRLTDDRVAALDELGIAWEPRQQQWTDGLARTAAWHARHGHLDLRSDAVDDDGFPIGVWLSTRRRELSENKLAAPRAAELTAIDPLWAHPGLRTGLLATDRYHAAHGPLGALRRFRDPDTGFNLGAWLQERRGEYLDEVLHPLVRDHLDHLGIDWRMPRRKSVQRQLEALARFRAEHGHLQVPADYRDDGLDVGTFVMAQRYAKQTGTINPAVAAALDELGMDWETQSERTWRLSLVAARRFHATHGHLRVPSGHDQDGVKLSTWIEERRADRRRGKLADDRIAALDELGIDWDPRATERQAYLAEAPHYLAEAKRYAAAHGHLKVPKTYVAPGSDRPLGRWLDRARARQQKGTFEPELAAALDAIDPTWAAPRPRKKA